MTIPEAADAYLLYKPGMTTSLNDQLIAKIKEHCAEENNKNDKGLEERLGYALLYQKLFTINILSPEMLKTLFSTGVAGMKWHHEGLFATRYTNFPALDRLAMFVHLKKEDDSTIPVRLMHYFESRLFGKSLKLTQAGMDIILRLSQLRAG
jgi:hypothetical protein